MKTRSLITLLLALVVLGISGCAQVSGDGQNATIRHSLLIPFAAGGFAIFAFVSAVGLFVSDEGFIKQYGLSFLFVIIGLVMIGVVVPNFAFSKVVITPETVTIHDSGWLSTSKRSFDRDGVTITAEESTRMTRRGRRTEIKYYFHSRGQKVSGGTFGEAIAEYLTKYPYSGNHTPSRSDADMVAAVRPTRQTESTRPTTSPANNWNPAAATNLAQSWPPINERNLPGYREHQMAESRRKADEQRKKQWGTINRQQPGTGYPNGMPGTPNRPRTGVPNRPRSGTPGAPGYGTPRYPGAPSYPPGFPRPPGFGGRR